MQRSLKLSTTMATYLTYVRGLAGKGQLSLLFVPGEFCYLMLNRNRAEVLEDRQEIGTYRHILTGAQVRELITLAEKTIPEEEQESDDEDISPGVPLLTYGTGQAHGTGQGNEPPRIVSFPLDRPLPKAVEIFDQQALA